VLASYREALRRADATSGRPNLDTARMRFPAAWTAAGLASLLATALLALSSSAEATASPLRAAAGSTHYVSPGGSDAASGASPHSAWRTLARASRAPLGAGDHLLLRRGGVWSERLEVSRSGSAARPLVISSYGRGRLPRIQGGRCVSIEGSHVTISEVEATGCHFAGIEVAGDHDLVTRTTVTRNPAGVFVARTATAARVVANRIARNDRMFVLTQGGHDDSGAFGVLVQGDGAVIARNRISGSDAFSHDFGRDGAAVEIYGARGTLVRRNTATDNHAFSELGNPRSAGNVFSRNVVRSSLRDSEFVVVPGAGSGFGPARGTALYGNRAVLTGGRSQGVVCYSGCGRDILRMRGNVVQAVLKAGYADNPFDEDCDLFLGGAIQLRLGPHSRFRRVHPGSASALRVERARRPHCTS
jgi:hypothetical protein